MFQLLKLTRLMQKKVILAESKNFHFCNLFHLAKMDRVCAMIESLWDTFIIFFKTIYGRDVIKEYEMEPRNMIAEHQGYIDALKDRDAEKIEEIII